MAGRFPLFVDACVRGPVVEALVRRGWDAVRAVDAQGEGAKDLALFLEAARLGRVFVTNDEPIHRIAREWLDKGRPFRMVFWPKRYDERLSAGEVVEAFEALATADDDAFEYPIVYLKPRPH